MICHIEELSLNAWPSLQTVVYDGWLVRFSNGYTTCELGNPIYGSTKHLDYKIRYCEDIFYARNLKPIFKIMECVYPETLDATLENRGYTAIDHVSLQLLSLSQLKEPSIHTVKVDEQLNGHWLN